jgi:DNA polymerase-3 subunit delta'
MVWPIVGHRWAVELLERAVRTDRLGHAYLIVGPPQIGKTTLAKVFAQALYCSSVVPCGSCRACRLVAADRHPDVSLVAPEKGSIRIESIRTLQRSISLSPVEGAYRVCIVRKFDMATLSAANCLLKTLEEPPPRVILVLTADRGEALLSTIISRCQVLSLRTVPTAEIVSTLRDRGVEDERARLLGHLARGRAGWAIDASRDDIVLQRRAEVLGELVSLDRAMFRQRFAWAERLSRDPDQLGHTLDVFSSWWHDVLVLAAGSSVQIANIDQRNLLGEWAARYDVPTVQRVLRSVRDALWRLEHNANRRLVLEVLMLELPVGSR